MRTPRPLTRTSLAVATAGLMVVSLAACGGTDSQETSGDNKSASSDGNSAEEVTMWTRAPLERQAKAAVDTYNAEHSNQIKLEILPNDDVEGKVGAAVQSDTLPCILAGDVVRIPYWTQQGVFADMTEKIEALPNIDQLQAGHIDAGTYDGKKHTLPFVSDISVMVWNKDLYQEAGLDPEKGPSTVKEFTEQAQAVAALNKDGVAGSYLSGQSGGALVFTLFPSIWADGEEVMSADGTEATLTSESAKAIFGAYRTLADTPNGLGAGSQEETGATWTAPFAEGKIGVMPYPYTAVTGLFEEAPFDIGVAGIPGSQGTTSTFLGGDAIGITSSCADTESAWEFMEWLMSDEAQQKVFADNNDTASSLTVLENGYANADPRTLIANATIKDGRSPVSVNFNEAFNAPGSPWQILIQNQVWGEGDLKSDNDAITAILSQQ